MLTADDRHLLVRTMLDLISDEERAEQGKNARLVAKKQAAAERAPLLAHQAEVDDKRLAELLGIGRSKTNGPLFTGDPQALLTARRNALEATMAAADATNEEGADQRRATWEEAVAARLDAARDLREAEAQLEAERAAAAEANHGAPPRLQLSLLGAELPPGRAFCSVPLAAARAEGCPLAGVSPAEVARRRSRKSDDDVAAATDDVLGSLELQRAHLKSALDRAGAAEKAAQRALAEAEESQRAEAARLEKERAALAQIERMLGHADATRREVEATEDELLRLEKELRRSYDRQEAFRKHHAEALGKISDRFAYVVRALLGDAMGGRIEDDGRHLALRVDEHGDREARRWRRSSSSPSTWPRSPPASRATAPSPASSSTTARARPTWTRPSTSASSSTRRAWRTASAASRASSTSSRPPPHPALPPARPLAHRPRPRRLTRRRPPARRRPLEIVDTLEAQRRSRI